MKVGEITENCEDCQSLSDKKEKDSEKRGDRVSRRRK